jgi:hypothetical protein
MPTTNTNEVNYAYCVEAAPGVPSTAWKDLVTSSSFTVGATVTKERPNVLSKTRQQQREIPVSLSASAEGEVPATIASLQHFIEGLMHNRSTNSDMYIPSTAINDVTIPGILRYQVPAITAAQAAKINIGTAGANDLAIFYTRNFSNPANNGFKTIANSVTAGATELTLVSASPLAAETPNVKRGAVLEYAGVGFTGLIGTKPVWTYNVSTKKATLNRGSTFNWAGAGVKVGQFIAIGGQAPDGTVVGAGQNTVPNDSYGVARVTGIVGNILELDKISTKLQRTVTFPTDLYIQIGKMVMNVPIDDANYLRETYQIQATYPTLGVGNTPVYFYQKGCYPNSLALSLTAASLGNINLNFVSLDREPATPTLKPGAVNSLQPAKDSSMSAAASMRRVRVTKLDESGDTIVLTDLQLTIDNGMTQTDVLGQLASYAISPAPISISATLKMLFTDATILDAVRNNVSLTADFVLSSNDGLVVIDLPEFTLGDDSVELIENKFVELNVTSTSFPDLRFGSSAILSFFSAPLPE